MQPRHRCLTTDAWLRCSQPRLPCRANTYITRISTCRMARLINHRLCVLPTSSDSLPFAAAEVAQARLTRCLLAQGRTEDAVASFKSHVGQGRILAGATSLPAEASAFVYMWHARQLIAAAAAGAPAALMFLSHACHGDT